MRLIFLFIKISFNQKMCICTKRDLYQIKANNFRVKQYHSKQVLASIWSVTYMPLFMLVLLFFSNYFIDASSMEMFSTEQFYVTSSTPQQSQNYFVDADSGFSYDLTFQNCTIRDAYRIGLVKKNGETEANRLLDKIFTEVQTLYRTNTGGQYQDFLAQEFPTNDELDDFVRERLYLDQMMCFALSWDTFDPSTHTFKLNMRFNYGDTPYSFVPQTLFQDSLYNQEYLALYARTGYLQVMTTATNTILNDLYGKEVDLELLHMPINTGVFSNNGGYNAIYALFPLTIAVFLASGHRFFQLVQEPHEEKLRKRLKLIGTRPIAFWVVDQFQDLIISLVLSPLIVAVGVVFQTTFVNYIYLQVWLIIYLVESFLLNNVIETVLSPTPAAIAQKTLEIVSLIISVYAVFLHEIRPMQVYITSVLPYMQIAWLVKFAGIASNIDVPIGFQYDSIFVHTVDLNIILYIALGELFLLLLIFMYFFPLRIATDERIIRPWYYPCVPRFWACSNRQQLIESDQRESSDLVEAEVANPEQRLIQMDSYDPSSLTMSSPLSRISTFTQKSLTLEDIHAGYGNQTIIEGLNLTLHRGEIVALIGPNGAGKSTLLQVLTGFKSPTKGEIDCFGVDLLQSFERGISQDLVGYCPQEIVLIENLTVEDNLRFFALFRNVQDVDPYVHKFITDFCLERYSQLLVKNISYGARKLLALAAAMMGDSQLIVLDEPFLHLEQYTKVKIHHLIKETSQHRLFIITSQKIKEVSEIADRVVIMEHGKIVQDTTPQKLRSDQNMGYSLQVKTEGPCDEAMDALKTLFTKYDRESIADQTEHFVVRSETNLFKIKIGFTLAPKFAQIFSEIDTLRDQLKIVNFKFLQANLEDAYISFMRDSKQTDFYQDGLPSQTQRHGREISYEEKTNQCQNFQLQVKRQLYYDFCEGKFYAMVLLMVLMLGQENVASWIFRYQPLFVYDYSNMASIYEISGDNSIYYNANFPDGSVQPITLMDNFAESQSQSLYSYSITDWTPEAGSSVMEVISQVADQVQDLTDQHYYVVHNQKESTPQVDKIFGSYYFYDYSLGPDVTDQFAKVGIFANMASAAAAPAYTSSLLQSVAQTATGEPITLSFMQNELPANNMLVATLDSSIAQVFGISLLTCVTFLQLRHIDQFSKGFKDGYNEAYRRKGGHIMTFFASQILLMFIHNLTLILLFNVMLIGFGYEFDFNLNLLGIEWALVEPLFTAILLSLAYFKFGLEAFEKIKIINAGFNTMFTAILIIYPILNASYELQTNLPSRIVKYAYELGWNLIPTYSFVVGVQIELTYKAHFLNNYNVLHGNDTLFSQLEGWNDHKLLHASQLIQLAVGLILFASLIYILKGGLKKQYSAKVERELPAEFLLETSELHESVKDELKRVQRQLFRDRKQMYSNIADDLIVFNLTAWFPKSEGNQIELQKYHRDNEYRQGNWALKGISFGLKKGERLVLLGTNSSGRTVTLKIILGLMQRVGGNIFFKDMQVSQWFKKEQMIRGLVGYCAQENNNDSSLTVEQQLTLFATLGCVKQVDVQREVDRYLKLFHLEDSRHVKAGKLSKGKERKLCIAMAFIGNSPLVLLDKPMLSVDALTLNEIYSAIREVSRDRMVIVSTTEPKVAYKLGTKIAIMKDGLFLRFGTLDNIMSLRDGTGLYGHLTFNQKRLERMCPDEDTQDLVGFITNHEMALECLQSFKDQLDLEQASVLDLDREYSASGALKEMYEQVEQGALIQPREFCLSVARAITIQKIVKLISSDVAQTNVIKQDADTFSIKIVSAESQVEYGKLFKLLDSLTRTQPVKHYSLEEKNHDINCFFDEVVSREKDFNESSRRVSVNDPSHPLLL